MEENEIPEIDGVPVPAIVFLCILCGCIVILCIVYQLLKRDMCCNLEAGLGGEPEKLTKDGYTELTEHFYEFDETEGPTTDDDPQSRKSSRRSSRRSSYELTVTSQSGGEVGLGDSASNYGADSIDIRISGPEDDGLKHAGKVLLEFDYTEAAEKLSVTVIRATDIPSKARGGSSAIQVRLVLLPIKSQRFKTKVRPASNPVFNETFSFTTVDQLALSQFSLRMRIYGQERYNQGRLIGEIVLPLKEIDMSPPTEEEKQVWKVLMPRALTSADSMFDLSDTVSLASFGSPKLAGSNQSLPQHSSTPELLVSLCYASLTGRLTVEVLKATNLRYLQMPRAPDSYIKIEVLSSRGKRVAKSKTTTRRNMYDPEFNESFVFQMSEQNLREVTLVFSVIALSKARKRKDVVGRFQMGKDASGIDEVEHWEEVINKKEHKSTYYHPLILENTYVKVSMFNSVGQQLAKSKTSIRRAMFDPEYNETFVFQIIEFDLAIVSLMFSILNIKKMRRKEIMGWFSIGRDNTSEDELIHWREMLEAKGHKVRKWHVLSAVNRTFDEEF